MSKTVVGILGLIVGLIVGYLGSAAIIGGATGMGVAVGLSSGICSVANAAVAEGLLTPEQVDRVMQRAASEIAEMSGKTAEGEITNTLASCKEVLARLRANAES